MSKVSSVLKACDRILAAVESDLSHDIYSKTEDKYKEDVMSKLSDIVEQVSKLCGDDVSCIIVDKELCFAPEAATSGKEAADCDALNEELSLLKAKNKELAAENEKLSAKNAKLKKKNVKLKDKVRKSKASEPNEALISLVAQLVKPAIANEPAVLDVKQVNASNDQPSKRSNVHEKTPIKASSHKGSNYVYYASQAKEFEAVADSLAYSNSVKNMDVRYVLMFMHKLVKNRFTDLDEVPKTKEGKSAYRVSQIPGVAINCCIALANAIESDDMDDYALMDGLFAWLEDSGRNPECRMLMPQSLTNANIKDLNCNSEVLDYAHSIWVEAVNAFNAESKKRGLSVYLYPDQFEGKLRTLGIV